MQAVKYFFVTLLLAGLWACKKDKADYLFQELPQQPPLTGSTVRLMNMGRTATELIINDTPLTSFTQPNIEGYYIGAKPTLYFQNGRLGASYTIPQKFIRQDGSTHIKIAGMMYGHTELVYPKEFDIREDVNNPTDFYNVLYGAHGGNTILTEDSLFAIPRSISPPANPEHFKIRLLNLSSSPDAASLEGDMTLVWADGTKVSTTTSDIASGKYSDYIELPYGTCQFKVMTSDGKVLPAVRVNAEELLSQVGRTTGTMTTGQNPVVDTKLTYAPIRTFQPGGVYTIMVCASMSFSALDAGSNSASPVGLNSYRIIADNKEALNITYGRLQAVSVIPGVSVSVSADNMPLQEGALAFGKATGYKTLINGTHLVQLTDASGKKLAEQTLRIQGSDNYTAWVYPGENGQPVLKLIANNLSGNFYLGNNPKGDDGSNDQYSYSMPLKVRFLNLSTDIPEVTFTGANGALLTGFLTYSGTASQHIQRGQVITDQPYMLFSPLTGINKLAVYASQPGVLPGDWVQEVPQLSGTDFIARPELYTSGLPPYETGVYTVALTGSLHPKNPGEAAARMIIIKHNQ
ncbi:DUF4397 domain-containing protein [Chitinophaga qingshengii]|uniref:DUF4397 domain-containing protein n=1 Tax=Chitinophaga qingshengii TaxID=1569794 RepID=A0ABR7TJE2_9BACT|nr:DUF4397 domain-containing protein [Chitinophaga qingshengii]MBC9929785.1 DUF4397 domain-containing protein [Chitinophaga qingshengii]